MTTWNLFLPFSLASTAFAIWAFIYLWAIKTDSSSTLHRRKIKVVNLLMATSVTTLFAFIVLLWLNLERPPLKTMGETRLWYSLFLLIVGWITWLRTSYTSVLGLSVVMSIVFMLINIIHPEVHSKELIPVLNSVWFIPHVVVYMFAYALIGCAFLITLQQSTIGWRYNPKALRHCDQLVWQGMALLTMGMMMGALWAKQAWGNYWSWDPKETWAAVTWILGLIYIHLRLRRGTSTKVAYLLVILIFLAFQMCWYGLNYLPMARNSVHIYSQY